MQGLLDCAYIIALSGNFLAEVTSGSAAIGVMHLAKGLEFRAVGVMAWTRRRSGREITWTSRASSRLLSFLRTSAEEFPGGSTSCAEGYIGDSLGGGCSRS